MSYDVVGKNIIRNDVKAKVTGNAKYTSDFYKRDMLVGKVLRSPYAHAKVKKIDKSKALALPGVEAVITYDDVPKNKFPTAGHPFNLNPKFRDKADRNILTNKARFVGDKVAAVVACDELVAEKALSLIDVEYEVLEPVFTPEDALKEGAPLIHEDSKRNIVSDVGYTIGDIEKAFKNSDFVFEGEYKTSIVQHCQMENHVAYAYVDDNDRIVIVTSTQIPHLARRMVGQALGIPWGKIRVIKPCVGGGFGSKQDICVEPLVAAMTLAAGGKPVKYELTREECMIDTRTRHSIKYKIKAGVNKDGRLLSMHIKALSNQGAYASHGHSIVMASGSKVRVLYPMAALKYEPITVYTNLPVGGAMRGYGSPQITFALESFMEDLSRKLNIDSIELRNRNFVKEGYTDPLDGNRVLSCGVRECVEKGKELISWDEKKARYKSQNGIKRRGVGMACFSYGSGTFPANAEVAGARIVLNQDGSIQLQIGATEIGQGSDTVFAQMVAEIIGIPVDMINVVSTQDTDVSPFDPGAFASRQTYVSGIAVSKSAKEIKEKVLKVASHMTNVPVSSMDIKNANVIYKHSDEVIMTLEDVSMYSYYDPKFAKPITSDVANKVRTNAFVFGTTFAEVEVDMETGEIEVIEIYNIHDSGKIINPALASGQVHGGVSMGIGYALTEELLFNGKTGKPLNNNLLDYKLPTTMDTPHIGVDFVETKDPTSPFGNKSIGEPPAISPAPAIRNAVLDATGVTFNEIPMTPQKVFERFKEVGLI